MNDCLVTKYKADSNNNNLPFLGAVLLSVKDTSSETAANHRIDITTINGGSCELEILDESAYSYFTDSNLSANLGKKVSVNGIVWIQNTTGHSIDVLLRNKYDVKELCQWDLYKPIDKSIDLSQLTGMHNIEYLSFPFIGDLSNIADIVSLKSIRSQDLGIYEVRTFGKVADFKNLINLEWITLGFTKVDGNIRDLGILTKITHLYIRQGYGLFGTLESFCEEQISKGRSVDTGVIDACFSQENVTLNNKSVKNYIYHIEFGSGGTCTIYKYASDTDTKEAEYDGSNWTYYDEFQ